MPDISEVEVDARGRISIGKLARGRDRFRVTVLDDGELLLTPVVSVSERELALLANPERAERLRQAIAHAEAGELKSFGPGYFTRLVGADVDDDQDEDSVVPLDHGIAVR